MLQHVIDDYKALALDTVINFSKFNQYAIVHHSTVIEGSTLTATETEVLLEEGLTPKGKPLLHSLMVTDHFRALQIVLKKADEGAAIDLGLIRDINAAVMHSTGSVYQTVFGEIDASKGMFRKSNVSAGGSYFVAFDKVERYTTDLCIYLQKELGRRKSVEDQLYLSFEAHFDLVSIHPFYDGNGRTSRLLMNFIQQYYALPLGIVFSADKAGYIEALKAARSADDKQIFYNFMVGQYNQFLSQEIEAYRKDIQL